MGAINESGELECHTLNVNIIEATPPVGVTDLSLEKRVSIFPNPTNGFLNILTTSTDEGLVVFIQDQLGRVVREMDLPPSTGVSISQFNLSHLIAGTYYLHITSSEESVVKTIQIQM